MTSARDARAATSSSYLTRSPRQRTTGTCSSWFTSWNEERTELLALGRDEKTGGFQVTATVKVPVRVPFGFHNEFVPGSELAGVW